MKFSTFNYFNRLVALLLMMVFVSQSLVSCVTPGTGKLVKTQVMDDGLEKKVLRQTGLTGAAAGFITGAAVGILLAAVQISLEEQRLGRKLTDSERSVYVAEATAIALAGGVFGWHKGQQKGAKVVATAKDRDNLKQLVQGAKNHNAYLANYNSNLRREIASAAAAKDKKRLQALGKEASTMLKNEDKTIATRTASSNKLPPAYRSGYQSTINPLVKERNELATTISKLAATEKSVSF